jgi:hypothetical protein
VSDSTCPALPQVIAARPRQDGGTLTKTGPVPARISTAVLLKYAHLPCPAEAAGCGEVGMTMTFLSTIWNPAGGVALYPMAEFDV